MLNKDNLYIHADDYGLTTGITHSLDGLIKDGCINSVSVIANGYDNFNFNFNLFKDIRICAHINIFENIPISNKKNLKNILNNNERFRQSFVFYILVYYFSFRSKRKIIEQIGIEVEAQLIDLSKMAGGFHNIKCIDSHNHIHMIPYIFDIFADLCKKYKIESIRTVREVYHLDFYKDNIFNTVFYIGLIKSFLLGFFTFINRKSVKNNGLLTNKYFIGVLFSGRMSLDSITKSLTRVKNKVSDKEYVEVVLHPGVAYKNERIYWDSSPSLAKFYMANGRKNENNILRRDFDLFEK
jgi:chitin disaccharide deacetylase